MWWKSSGGGPVQGMARAASACERQDPEPGGLPLPDGRGPVFRLPVFKAGLALLAAAPALLLATSALAPTGFTGAPGEFTCTSCHGGFENSGPGSLTIEAVDYAPGQKQTIRVRIADPNQRRWGFSITARLRRAPMNFNLRAGSFESNGANVFATPDGRYAVSQNAPSATGSFTFEIPWTAPDDAGGVIFYATGNAANGNGAQNGDRIYTALKEVALAGGTPRPTINAGGIITANQFGAAPRAASGSWIEIYGTNFTTAQRTWEGAFVGDNAPTALGDLSVIINGRAAPLAFANAGQINAQAPADSATGLLEVRVRRAGVESDSFALEKTTEAPALYAPAALRVNNRQFAGAFFPNSTTFAGNFPGLNSRVAKPGDTLIFYGVGFGPVVPLEGTAAIPVAGTIVRQLNRTARPVRFRFDQTEGAAGYAGLAPGYVGLYQFNVTVPQIGPGVVALNVTLDGQPIGQSLFLEIAN